MFVPMLVAMNANVLQKAVIIIHYLPSILLCDISFAAWNFIWPVARSIPACRVPPDHHHLMSNTHFTSLAR